MGLKIVRKEPVLFFVYAFRGHVPANWSAILVSGEEINAVPATGCESSKGVDLRRETSGPITRSVSRGARVQDHREIRWLEFAAMVVPRKGLRSLGDGHAAPAAP